MKMLVGLEELQDKASPVQVLLSRLDFPAVHQILLHVVPPVAPSWWHVDPMLGASEAERSERKKVAHAERLLAAMDPDTRSKVVVGRPAGTILDEADRLGAEIIAANASQHTALKALFTGSVARALATAATQSVLLARPSKSEGSIRAIFATDHSEYAEQCVAALIQLAPRGIGHLTVLTAYPEQTEKTFTTEMDGGRPRVEARCGQIVTQLTGNIGMPETIFDYRVVPGRASDVIAQTMAETGAELLILGAKGHSVVERLVLGSVSFGQAIGSHPYSVLILRSNS